MLIEELIEGNRHWILVLAIPGAIIFAVLMVYLMRRATIKKLAPLALELGGEVVMSFWKGAFVRLLSWGSEIRISVTMGGQNSPPYLIIEQVVPLGFDISISAENIATRKLEDWGLLKDIKTGDPVFDDRYLIRSSDEVRAQNLLMDPKKKDAVNHFFNHGYTEIISSKDSVVIRKAGYSSNDLDPDLMRSNLEQLQVFVSE